MSARVCKADAEAVVDLIRFIGWAEADGAMYGAVRATEALEALASITGIPISKLREVADTGHRPSLKAAI